MHLRLVALTLFLSFALAQSTHVVQPGETLYRIANQYGTTVEALQTLNNISDPTQLKVGQVLKIGGPSAQPQANRLTNLPTPFTSITLPSKVMQGQAFRVRIEAGGASVEVAFMGTRLVLKGTDLLLAVAALQQPGTYPLEFRAGGVVYKTTLQIAESLRGRQALTLDKETLNMLQPDKVKAEHDRLLAICAAGPERQTWQSAWKKPIASNRITTAFGMRRSCNGGPYRSYHEGIDYGAANGTPVYAPAPGVVGLAEPLFVRGKAIVLQHGLGICSGFFHLSKIAVAPGQRVNTGDLIGYVGNTGLSTGPHLHFEIRVQGVPTDPAPWYFRTP